MCLNVLIKNVFKRSYKKRVNYKSKIFNEVSFILIV